MGRKMFGSIRMGCDNTAITVRLKRFDSIEEKGHAVEFESHALSEKSADKAARLKAGLGKGEVSRRISIPVRPGR